MLLGRKKLTLRPKTFVKNFEKFQIKFIYSEKATKFCKIFTLLLSYVTSVMQKNVPRAVVIYYCAFFCVTDISASQK